MYLCRPGPIVQWIVYEPPKLVILVRIQMGPLPFFLICNHTALLLAWLSVLEILVHQFAVLRQDLARLQVLIPFDQELIAETVGASLIQ